MAEVNLQIDGRVYPVECDDGQENRVAELGAYVDQRMREVAPAANGNKAQAMVLTSLLLADEVYDLYDRVREVETALKAEQSIPTTIEYAGMEPQEEQELGNFILRMTQRVEQICTRARSSKHN